MLSRRLVKPNDDGVVRNGLVGYWHYAQGVSGSMWNNIAPFTTGSYNGTINGAVIQSDGVLFDGVNDYVQIGAFPDLNGLSAFTYQVLVTAPVDTTTRGILSLYSDDNNRFGLYYTTGKLPAYSYRVDGGFNNLIATVAPTADVLLTVTTDSSGRKFYIDTSLNLSDSALVTLLTINNFTIGALLSGTPSTVSTFFKGKIRAVRIYNRALTISEIVQNHGLKTAVGL